MSVRGRALTQIRVRLIVVLEDEAYVGWSDCFAAFVLRSGVVETISVATVHRLLEHCLIFTLVLHDGWCKVSLHRTVLTPIIEMVLLLFFFAGGLVHRVPINVLHQVPLFGLRPLIASEELKEPMLVLLLLVFASVVDLVPVVDFRSIVTQLHSFWLATEAFYTL